MSKLIEELYTIPEWNTIGKVMKQEFRAMDSELLDCLDQQIIAEVLESYLYECRDLVARLVMEKVKEEWRKESKDEWDNLINTLKGKNND